MLNAFSNLRSTRSTAAQLLGTLNVRQFAGAATFLHKRKSFIS